MGQNLKLKAMLKQTDKIAIWMESSLDDDYGKMGISALRYLDNEILCVIDSVFAGKKLSEVSIIKKDIPIVDNINKAKAMGANVLLLGVLTSGGVRPNSWNDVIKEALNQGIFLFHYFNNFFTPFVELILNILLLLFLINFIWGKIKENNNEIKLDAKEDKKNLTNTIYKTFGFTYLNPHVYSDTVFFLGNFSKSFSIDQKYLFGIGASIASFIFFFVLGYLSKYLSNYLVDKKIWKIINFIIIIFMSFLALYVLTNILK